jgi:uncharacterized protein
MPEYLAPGVYLEEVSYRAKSIEGVSTTTTGFVGPTRFGPITGAPELVTSLMEFEATFGDGQPLAFGGSLMTNHVWQAARAFFEQGGKRLYVRRVHRGAGGTASAPLGAITFAARHPGAAGQVRVAITLQLGANILTKVGGELSAGGLQPGDIVVVRSSANAAGLYRAVLAADGSWSFVDDWTDPANPDTVTIASLTDGHAEVRILTAALDIGPLTGHVPSFAASGLAVSPASKRPSLTAMLAAGAAGPAPAMIADPPAPIPWKTLFEALASGAAAGEIAAATIDLAAKQAAAARAGLTDETADKNARDAAQTASDNAAQAAEIAQQDAAANPGDTAKQEAAAAAQADAAAKLNALHGAQAKVEGWAAVDAANARLAAANAAGASTAAAVTWLTGALTDPAHAVTAWPLWVDLQGGNDGSRPTLAEYEGSDDPGAKHGLLAFEDIDDISIVACPGVTDGYLAGEGDEADAILQALISHAERMRYRIAVLDSGPGMTLSEVQEMRGRMDSNYAALYYPWVTVLDPITGDELDLPPSGFMAGIYARNDINRAVWKAPANEVVTGALRFERPINKAEQEVLNPRGINCLRFFEGRGNRVWGARTISSDPEWKYVNLRRYFAYLERSIDVGTQWAVFEPNGERLWANVRQTISDFLLNEFQMGALLGTKPENAFFVKCDRSTMTQNDLDNGRLVCLIGVAALRPAEFVIFRIGQWTADAKR